jgi:hypothetical protein
MAAFFVLSRLQKSIHFHLCYGALFKTIIKSLILANEIAHVSNKNKNEIILINRGDN